MDLLRPFRRLRDKVVRTINPTDGDLLLEHWKQVFGVDKTVKDEWNARFDEWEALYAGNREFGNMRGASEKTPRTLVNFPKRFIEQHIDLGIPDADFKPVAQDDEDVVKSLESIVKYTIRSAKPSFEEINQVAERRVWKLGGCFFKVHWDNTIRRAGFVGDVTISDPHPKDIIPNAGASCIDDMEHYHHVVNKTGNYILRKWPHLTIEDLEDKAVLYAEYDEMLGAQDITVSGESKHSSGLAKFSVIETTYKDQEGDICKLWWSGDLLVEHIPKFFYRRNEVGEPLDKEVVSEPIYTSSGSDTKQLIPEGAEADYYVPKCWDIIYEPCIPRDKCFWGMSIYEDVKDLLESIKKMVYIQEEKILKGTTKIFTTDENVADRIKDPTSEVILVQDLSLVKEVQFGNDGERALLWLEKMREWMQQIMGATDPALGQPSSDITSGKQAEMYIAQSQLMTDIKSASKTAAYKRLYRVISDFHLAFSDYDRPFRLEDVSGDGRAQYGVFNRLNMLRDRNGNYVYPDYDIEISVESGFMQSKSEILRMLTWLASTGRFEFSPANMVLLRALDKLGVPHLREAIQTMQDALQQQMMMGATPQMQGGAPLEEPPS